MLLSTFPSINANAVDFDEPCTEIIDEPSAGLVYLYSLSASNYNNSLCVNAIIRAYSDMKEIGFKNVTVQYSYDGSNWYDEWNAGDFLTYNSNRYDLANYIIALDRNGCYYRISCKCYAQKSFLNTQSATVTSNSVWIG